MLRHFKETSSSSVEQTLFASLERKSQRKVSKEGSFPWLNLIQWITSIRNWIPGGKFPLRMLRISRSKVKLKIQILNFKAKSLVKQFERLLGKQSRHGQRCVLAAQTFNTDFAGLNFNYCRIVWLFIVRSGSSGDLVDYLTDPASLAN